MPFITAPAPLADTKRARSSSLEASCLRTTSAAAADDLAAATIQI